MPHGDANRVFLHVSSITDSSSTSQRHPRSGQPRVGPGKPWYKKWWLWAAAAVVVVGVGVGVGVAVDQANEPDPDFSVHIRF